MDSNSDNSDASSSANESESEEEGEEEGSKFVNSSRPKNETAEEKKVLQFSVIYLFTNFVCYNFSSKLFQQRKKELKDQKAEKRKTKIKKHVKKRKEKLQKANSKK